LATLVAGYLAHALRVLLAALAMLAIAIALWLLVGILTALLGVRSPTLVLVSAGLIALVALIVGGYISAKRITPNSLLHAALAGTVASLLYVCIFTTGLWTISCSVVVAAGIAAAVGAAIARSRRTRPNNRWSGP
jgi:hypothetical protein